MTTYALFEIVMVALLVGACAFALALRLLPKAWLKAPLSAWLDREGMPAGLRGVGAKWRGESKSGCANGCCASGDGCATGRDQPAIDSSRSTRRIPLTLH